MRREFETEKAKLFERARQAGAPTMPAIAVYELPAPVRKYLEATRAVGATAPRGARLLQRGEIRTAPDKPWMPLHSEQVYAMEPPGFLWLARARLAPLVWLMARDSYLDRAGRMLIQLFGAITVADARGPEIDQGAGLRYWGEILAFPEMALSPHLHWEPVSDRRARFTVTESPPALTAEVEFDERGLMTATHAHRHMSAGAGLTPWSGYFREWKAIDGRFIPSIWEAAWRLPEEFRYIRLEVRNVETF